MNIIDDAFALLLIIAFLAWIIYGLISFIKDYKDSFLAIKDDLKNIRYKFNQTSRENVMSRLQKVVILIGAFFLIYFIFVAPPTQTISVKNPEHRPYDRRTPAYIEQSVTDTNLLFYHTVGVIGATTALVLILKPTHKG